LYQVTTQNGNLQNIRRGIGNLSVSYTQTHDQFTNPFQSVYWLDPFLLPSGFTTTLQPKSMARYFSKNNMSTSISVVLGATTTERFNYFYVNGILPKSINYEIETAKNKVSDLVYVFDIQYRAKESAGF
jgi:hypothetical protein